MKNLDRENKTPILREKSKWVKARAWETNPLAYFPVNAPAVYIPLMLF